MEVAGRERLFCEQFGPTIRSDKERKVRFSWKGVVELDLITEAGWGSWAVRALK